MNELAVWLFGAHVATIDHERRRPRLTYTTSARRQYAAGTPLLSVSLPVRAERHPPGVVRAFLDGLLPEGEARRAIARDVGVEADDTFGLIEALGRDCAGAIVIQPIDEASVPPTTTEHVEPIAERELEDLVTNLRRAPLGAGGRVRISLAGVQEKLLLTRLPDGRWGRPVDGAPSTHILKPEIAAYPNTVENEAFCMRVAHHLGIPVARVETMQIGGRNLLVVERYDRVSHADGTVERVHQEDFCQATGTRPQDKYADDGGPPLARIAAIVAAVAPPASLEQLLRAVTLNTIVGNGDAHAKNYSLLHSQPGALQLAPLYDVLCTLVYGADRLALYIDGVERADRVRRRHLVNEAARWGITRRRSEAIISEIFERAPSAIAAARAEAVGLPESIVDAVNEQLERLRDSQ